MNAEQVSRLLMEQLEAAKIADEMASIAAARSRQRPDLVSEASRSHDSKVSDSPTRAELDARMGQARAEGETQFEKLRGDIRELKSASVGKASFFLGLIATFGALVAVLAYGGQWFGLGLQSHESLVAAAKEGAAQALAAMNKTAP